MRQFGAGNFRTGKAEEAVIIFGFFLPTLCMDPFSFGAESTTQQKIYTWNKFEALPITMHTHRTRKLTKVTQTRPCVSMRDIWDASLV